MRRERLSPLFEVMERESAFTETPKLDNTLIKRPMSGAIKEIDLRWIQKNRA